MTESWVGEKKERGEDGRTEGERVGGKGVQ